jgi:hypothetical protein
LVTVKFIALEVPPSGAGFVTVTGDVPAEAILASPMTAVNCVELMNVAGAATPPNLTVEDASNFVPLIVSVKATPPAATLMGEIEVSVGA